MNITAHIQKLLELMGFPEHQVSVDEEHRKVLVVVDDELFRSQLPTALPAFEHLINLMLRRENLPSFVVDVNYYRRERERLIIELAKAGAKKAILTKTDVALPPMNAYERRLVHVEIATNPDLKTESDGEGKDRHIIIKHINI